MGGVPVVGPSGKEAQTFDEFGDALQPQQGEAQEKGDLRENAEYKAALEKQQILQTTLTNLENDLKMAHIITSSVVPSDFISVGSKVRLTEENTGDMFVYTILDKWDADVDKGIISFRSPLGRALLDHRKGEVVTFGKAEMEQKFKVISIERAITEDGRIS